MRNLYPTTLSASILLTPIYLFAQLLVYLTVLCSNGMHLQVYQKMMVKGSLILVSRAGDWTAKLIRSPPTKLWVRGIPTMGVLHIAPIFKKVVLVATGSGIGPVLSLLTKVKIDCRILWSTPNPEATYSSSVIDNVCQADPAAIIINTSVSGRPDLVNQSYELYSKSGAEAIFIISNPRVTRTVVYGLESRGVPIFAPIFDS